MRLIAQTHVVGMAIVFTMAEFVFANKVGMEEHLIAHIVSILSSSLTIA